MSSTLNNDAFYRGYLTKTAEAAPRSTTALDSYTPPAYDGRMDYVSGLDSRRPTQIGMPQRRGINISNWGGKLKYMMPWVSKDTRIYMPPAPLTSKNSSTPWGQQ
jgi:hypothetical protein